MVALALPAVAPVATGAQIPGCVRTADPTRSVARLWDEALLDAIRRDFPAPTVHSRNLFHVSAAMYDAWAAYDPVADGYFVDESLRADDVQAAREEAMSYAAWRILRQRYANAVGAEESLAAFDATMASLCYPLDVTATEGSDPAALGNRIAEAILVRGAVDGAHEESGYRSPDYVPVNEPLIVKRSGTRMSDPDRWQPLAFDFQETQNGQALPDKVQTFVGPFWGHVESFGLMTSDAGLPIDPGSPPRFRDPETRAEYIREAVDVIAKSSQLDPGDEVLIDISPGATGDNDLGTNDGDGHSINPFTGVPYEPVIVPRADFARALAEFWADGPSSETPPGHWNVIANAVADAPGFVPRIGGQGPVVDQLEWDVKTYFALNGAVHDAAIAAWGAKGYYDSARPISMIRYLAGRGQSTRKGRPSYDPDGLPLIPGLIEEVTARSARPGGKHEALRKHIGEIAVKAWAGNPEDPETQTGGVGWILAADWVPYQRSTFVTPAFAAYVSGHSSFSRAAAEVLTAMTGSAYFPGGLSSWVVPAGSLDFEAGPTVDVPLQWATYYDAADQAGLSRLYGGIHIESDDLDGRRVGSECGKIAWQLAQRYFSGSARA
jgi:hypothetical protein